MGTGEEHGELAYYRPLFVCLKPKWKL